MKKKLLSIALILSSTAAWAEPTDTDLATAIDIGSTLKLQQDITQTYAASTNYQAIAINDDGTSTIFGPKFESPEGPVALRISNSSDYTGVCLLYGYKEHVFTNYFTRASDQRDTAARINENGKFDGTVDPSDHLMDDHGPAFTLDVISSIICR